MLLVLQRDTETEFSHALGPVWHVGDDLELYSAGTSPQRARYIVSLFFRYLTLAALLTSYIAICNIPVIITDCMLIRKVFDLPIYRYLYTYIPIYLYTYITIDTCYINRSHGRRNQGAGGA